MHILQIKEGPRCPRCNLLLPHANCLDEENVVFRSSPMGLTVDDGAHSDAQERAWKRNGESRRRRAVRTTRPQSNDHPWKNAGRALFEEFRAHGRAGR